MCLCDGLNIHSSVTVDIVSAVEFNETGEYIATGDRGGRVVIFERCQVCPILSPALLCKYLLTLIF